jgi:enamine deaminase RidA (YjgF/YER057c/UK114 family)
VTFSSWELLQANRLVTAAGPYVSHTGPLPTSSCSLSLAQLTSTSSFTPCQSQAIKTPSAIYCSGQIPCDASGQLVEGTIQEKTASCIGNLKAVLEEAGSSIAKVVKVNVFLTDMANFAVRRPCRSPPASDLASPPSLGKIPKRAQLGEEEKGMNGPGVVGHSHR